MISYYVLIVIACILLQHYIFKLVINLIEVRNSFESFNSIFK